MCNQVNLFDDGQALMAEVQDHNQLKDMAKNVTTITTLEDRVNEWIKKVMEVSVGFGGLEGTWYPRISVGLRSSGSSSL